MEDEFSLIQLRKRLGLVQADMARRMGMSLRPYQELETNLRRTRRRHVRLAELVALDVAVEKEDPDLAPASIRGKAIEFVRLILRENLQQKASKLAEMLLVVKD
jgi:transcriptional regulator with XRE-family HTH domain